MSGARAPVLADERRLLIAAMGRARRRLVVTAVDAGDGDAADLILPSSFFHDIAAHATDTDTPAPVPVAAPAVLSVPAVVGRLRAVVARRRAASVMTIGPVPQCNWPVAEAGVRGADPSEWQSATAVSTAEPLWSGPDRTVDLSPSILQNLQDCRCAGCSNATAGAPPATSGPRRGRSSTP
jgi:hypothetical protein